MPTGLHDKQILNELRRLNASSSSCVTKSYTDVVSALASSGSNAYGTYTASEKIRAIEIQTNGGGTGETLEIEITKSDGSILTFNMYHGAFWSYESQVKEAPITDIIVTNSGSTAVNYIINIVSRG